MTMKMKECMFTDDLLSLPLVERVQKFFGDWQKVEGMPLLGDDERYYLDERVIRYHYDEVYGIYLVCTDNIECVYLYAPCSIDYVGWILAAPEERSEVLSCMEKKVIPHSYLMNIGEYDGRTFDINWLFYTQDGYCVDKEVLEECSKLIETNIKLFVSDEQLILL